MEGHRHGSSIVLADGRPRGLGRLGCLVFTCDARKPIKPKARVERRIMVSFILHMRSARRVSLSLSLSGLDKPVAGRRPPPSSSHRAWRRGDGDLVEGSRAPVDRRSSWGYFSSSRFVYSPAMASVSLRVALDFPRQSRCAPSLSLPTPNPLGFSTRPTWEISRDPENKWPAAASRKCFHQYFHHNISRKKTTFPGKMRARN